MLVLLLLVSCALAGTALVLLLVRRPSPAPRRAIVAQYAPPAGIGVLVGGVVTGDRRRSIAAQLVDLAVRGHLAIRPPATPSGSYAVQLLRADGLDDAELATVRALFGADAALGAVAALGTTNPAVLRRLRWAQFRAETMATEQGLRLADRRGGVALAVASAVAVGRRDG